MSSFAGRFLATRGYVGTRPTGLEGPGELIISPEGIRFACQRPRWGLIHALSAAVAIPAAGAALFAVMNVMDRWIHSADGDMRRFVAIGGAVLVGVFLAVRALLRRLLRPVAFEVTVGFLYVLSVRPLAPARVELVTTALQLQGVTLFESTDRARLVDAYGAMRHGSEAVLHVGPPSSRPG